MIKPGYWLVFLCGLVVAGRVYGADSSLRVDLVTMSENAQLTPTGATPGFLLEYPAWDEKKNKRRLWLVGPKLNDREWHEFEFSFKVNKNTCAALSFSWMKSHQPGRNAYGMLMDVRASGIVLKNTKFSNGFQFWKRRNPLTSKMVNAPYVLLSADNDLSQEIQLPADTEITICGRCRMADPSDINFYPESQEHTLLTGEWKLILNHRTGWLNSIFFRGKKVYSAVPDGSLPLMDFRLESNKNFFSNGDVRFQSYQFDAVQGVLLLHFISPEWQFTQKIQCNYNHVPGLLALSAEIANQSARRIKFRNVFYHYQLSDSGEYLYPGTFFYDKTGPFGDFRNVSQSPFERQGRFQDLRKLKSFKILSHCPVILLRPIDSFCQIHLMEKYYDSSSSILRFHGKQLVTENRISSCGWCEPKQSQVFDTLFIQMVPDKIESALKSGIARLYRNLNWKVPDGRPDWIRDISLCGSEMDRFSMLTFRDFAQHDLDRIRKLGFNTLWMLPIHRGPVNYVPTNFFEVEPSYGSWDEYCSLVGKLNQNGIRVIQDIVPHGGKVSAPLTQYVFGETGYMLAGRAVDYNDPSWIKHMQKVVGFYCESGVSGFRVDAAGGSGMPNWRTFGFPSHRPLLVDFNDRFHIPRNSHRQVDLLAWQECLKDNKGILPPLSYERASMSGLHGGRNLCRAIRSSAKEKNSKNMTLLEVHGFPYTMEGDLTYDMLFVGLIDKLRMTTATDFVPKLVRWLRDQEYADIEDALLMRYVSNYDNPASCPVYLYNPYRVLTALAFFAKGVPQVFLEKTVGHGFFLQRLNQIRTRIPELRRGSALYETVTSAPEVLKIVRSWHGRSSIVLINFSSERRQAFVVLPDTLRSTVLTDLYSQKKVNSYSTEKIQYELEPWGIAVITACDLPKETEFQAPNHHIIAAPELNGKTVTTGTYSVEISRDGTIKFLRDAEGKELLAHCDILFPVDRRSFEKPEFYSRKIPNGIRLSFDYGSGSRKIFSINYDCFSDRLKMHVKSDIAGSVVKLYSSSLENYRVNTCWGEARDWVEPSKKPRDLKIRYPRMGRSRFPVDPFLLWSSCFAPLDLNHPEIIFFQQTSGLKIVDKTCRAKLSLKSQAGSDSGLNLLWDIPEKQAVSIVLLPGQTQSDYRNGAIWKRGTLTCRNSGIGWEIENQHYRMELSFQGTVRKLTDKKNGKTVFRNQSVSSSRKNSSNSQDDELEPLISVSTVGSGIELTFRTELRQRKKLPEYPLMLETKYHVDESVGIKIQNCLTVVAGVYPATKFNWSADTGESGLTVLDCGDVSAWNKNQQNLKVSFLPAESESVAYPQTGYHLDFFINPVEKKITLKRYCSPLKIQFDDDPSFEQMGARYSVRAQQRIPYDQLDFSTRFWYTSRYRSFLNFKQEDKDSNGLQLYYPDPYIMKNLSPAKLEEGEYVLSVTIRGIELYGDWHSGPIHKRTPAVGPRINCPLWIELRYWLKDGKMVTVKKTVRLPPGTTDWQVEKIRFRIKKTGYSPVFHLSAKPERDGCLVIGRIALSPVDRNGK